MENNVISNEAEIRVTLLGTGAPTPVMNRFGPSTLVEAGGETLLFDAGRGALQRLNQLQPPVKHVRQIFLTHLHSDHTVGLPDLWLTGWLNGRPDSPLHVRGPRGTREMMSYLDRAFDYDIRIRLYDDRLPPQGVVVLAEDIEEGIVYEHNGVRVTAFLVDHFPIQPSFGYRIDYQGRSVVLSGDTRYSEPLISRARGADVVIHEVLVAGLVKSRSSINPEAMDRVVAHHTTAEQAGELFSRISPRLGVFTHIIPVNATASDVISPARKTYSGPLEVGEDLMVINIGKEVTVRKGLP